MAPRSIVGLWGTDFVQDHFCCLQPTNSCEAYTARVYSFRSEQLLYHTPTAHTLDETAFKWTKSIGKTKDELASI